MKPAFIEEMKKYLLAERQDLLESLKKNDEDFVESFADSIPKDFADLASYSTDRDMLEFIGESNVKKLQKIDSALDRIMQGKYGRCIGCNELIPEDRLKALPYALKCISCQSKSEKKMRV